jgi:1,4-dihydroxy-2-naphthoate polyprenyltransferase
VIERSTIQLLRFHFSFFLMPVFLFALSETTHVNTLHAIIVFIILHVLVYPASNGYNSYMDRDEGSIGGIAKPLAPTKQLFWGSIVMDSIAILSSLYISYYFAAGLLCYIIASRAYSYRGIRLKKYPVGGYLTVIFFQGAVTYFLVIHACSADKTLQWWLPVC